MAELSETIQRAKTLQRRARDLGFIRGNELDVKRKLDEEVGELIVALDEVHIIEKPGAREDLEDELGDVFMLLVRVALENDIDLEQCLEQCCEKMFVRLNHLETICDKLNMRPETLPIKMMRHVYAIAKEKADSYLKTP